MQRRCVMNLRPEHAVDHHLFIRVGACGMGAHGWMDWRLKPNFAVQSSVPYEYELIRRESRSGTLSPRRP